MHTSKKQSYDYLTPPNLSVLMPVFNSVEFLELAIKSILNQHYEDYEFIIIDDGSIDDTPEIIRHYANLDSRITSLRLDENKGVAEALNFGLSVAQGKFLARMDSEDIALPERFMKQVTFLEEHPEIGLVGTQTKFIDEKGDYVEQPEWVKPLDHNTLVWSLLYETPISHPSIMTYTRIIKDVGGYNPNYPNEDMHLWTRLALVTHMANLDEVLLQYRMPPERHEAQLLYWEPHVQRVAKEYMETILERKVDPHLVKVFYFFQKYRGYSSEIESINFTEALEICALLEELFQAMVNKNIFIPNSIEIVSTLMSQQTRQLVAFAVRDKNLLAFSPPLLEK